MYIPKSTDLEVSLKTEESKAVIEGKTAVPFSSFIKLVLQRKVEGLFKNWGKEPVIVSSDLLTDLANAPQDSYENKTHTLIVTLGVGIVCGVLLFAAAQLLADLLFDFSLGAKEFGFIVVGIIGIGVIASILMRTQKTGRAQKIADALDAFAGMLKK